MRLTAIVCNYNHAEYLSQALTALLESRRPPDEIIVVDDGSKDQSATIINEYASRYPTIRVIWHETNQGWHAGTAHALEIATGDWIYSGAADDYVLPEFFSRAEEMVRRWPEAGIVSGAFRRILPNGEFLRREGLKGYREPRFISPSEFRREKQLAWGSLSPSSLFHRSAIDAAGGFRKELGYWSDTFVVRVAGLQRGMIYFPEDCVCFREMTGGMSGSGSRNLDRVSSIVANAERLMRSPEFAGTFTSEDVDWWLKHVEPVLRRFMRAHFAAQMDIAFAPVIDMLLHPPVDASTVSRVLHWFSRKMLAAAYRPARWIVSRTRANSFWKTSMADQCRANAMAPKL